MAITTASLVPDPPKRKAEEAKLHKAVAVYLRFCLVEDAFWFHVPNGGKRHDTIAAQLAGMGVKAGIPDLCIIYRAKAHFIELKIDHAYLSAIQKQVHQQLNRAGARVATCRSIPEVESALDAWGIPLRGEVVPKRLRNVRVPAPGEVLL